MTDNPNNAHHYTLYTGEMTKEQVTAAFTKKYGYPPEQILKMFPGSNREWWAGPVKGQNRGSK